MIRPNKVQSLVCLSGCVCVRKAGWQKKGTGNEPGIRNSWATIPCQFGTYRGPEYQMPSLKMPALFALSVTGVSVRQCVWESFPADTFEGSIYTVQTEAEPHPLPVCQHQGVLGARLGLAPRPVAGKQKLGFNHLQAGAKSPRPSAAFPGLV